MNKKALKFAFIIIVAGFLVLFMCFNPNRGSFNHAVFEGGVPNPITSNREIMQEIIETDRQCYQNADDPRVKRNNYEFYSVYDVQVSNTQTVHVLGVLGMFRLMNS